MEPEQYPGIGRFDFYVAVVIAVLAVILGIVVVPVVWPQRVYIAWTTVALLALFVVLRFIMAWEHHRADILAKRNRARVVHESDAGFGYEHQGEIRGYSHTPAYEPGTALMPLPPDDAFPFEEQAPVSYPTTFKELALAGHVGPDRPFVLGFDELTGNPVQIPRITSLGIGGMQGSGKTVTTLLLMMEAVAKYNGRIRFIVTDPHMFVEGEEALMAMAQPLLPFFLSIAELHDTVPESDHEYHALLDRLENLPNPTIGGSELKGWMDVVRLEMERRLRGKTGLVWVIVMDEFVDIMSDEETAGPVALMLERLNQQGRKMGMFALLVSQEWKATRTGGSELRHSIVTFVLHNMAESIARLIVPPDVAHQAMSMDVGQAILHSRGMSKVVRVPYVNEQDAEWLMARYDPKPMKMQIREISKLTIEREPNAINAPYTEISSASYTELPGLDHLPLPEPSREFQMEALQPRAQAAQQDTVSPAVNLPDGFSRTELEQIRQLFAEGMTETAIARQVYGVTARRAVAQATEHVHEQLVWMMNNAWN